MQAGLTSRIHYTVKRSDVCAVSTRNWAVSIAEVAIEAEKVASDIPKY